MIWVVGYWRCGTNWVTTLLSPFVDRVIADSDVTDNMGIESFRNVYPDLRFKRNKLRKLKTYGTVACKMNCLRLKEARVLVECFPKSRFVNVIRNDNAVVDSIVNPKENSFPKREFAGMNRRKAKDFVREWKGEHWYFSSDEFRKRTYRIQYEHLLSNFVDEFAKFCVWVNGSFDERFLSMVPGPRK